MSFKILNTVYINPDNNLNFQKENVLLKRKWVVVSIDEESICIKTNNLHQELRIFDPISKFVLKTTNHNLLLSSKKIHFVDNELLNKEIPLSYYKVTYVEKWKTFLGIPYKKIVVPVFYRKQG